MWENVVQPPPTIGEGIFTLIFFVFIFAILAHDLIAGPKKKDDGDDQQRID